MDPQRKTRKDRIRKSLSFIQSSLAFPEPEGYKDFLVQLVVDLLDEGNACFKDGDHQRAMQGFSEGLSVSSYASAEGIQIPDVLLESLYVKRATAFHSMGDFDGGVKDCEKALEVCKESYRALYRKAVCLKELGRYREAYSCTTDCLLITRLDEKVNMLAEELAVHLRLKNRKPYVSAEVPVIHMGNGVNPLSSVAPVTFPSMLVPPSPAVTSNSHRPAAPLPAAPPPAAPPANTQFEDSEVIGDDLDSLLDYLQDETQQPATTHAEDTLPVAVAAPGHQPPPAFYNPVGNTLNCLDSLLNGHGTPDPLDDLPALESLDKIMLAGPDPHKLSVSSLALDALDGFDSDCPGLEPITGAARGGPSFGGPSFGGPSFGGPLLGGPLLGGPSLGGPSLGDLDPAVAAVGPSIHISYDVNALDQFDTLDTLDAFTSVEARTAAASPVATAKGAAGLHPHSDFTAIGVAGSHRAAVAAPRTRSPKNNHSQRNGKASPAASHSLSATHEFMQACATCFPRGGEGVYTFVHKPDLDHICKRDILLCRRKADPPPEWTRVRQPPSLVSFFGPFKLCRELLASDKGLCKYGEECTFAFNQLEIDVWTEERKRKLNRKLLFKPGSVELDPAISLRLLLQEHKGLFLFLCQECFDTKPRIISRRRLEDPTICSNWDAPHAFDANKCLAFVVKTTSIFYRKVRPRSVLCTLELCCHASRNACPKDDDCLYAHSVIELKTWELQRDTGISPDEIVNVSTKYHEGEQKQISNKQKTNRLATGNVASTPGAGVGKNLKLKMRFVCAHCWKGGLTSDPDKTLKSCTGKTKHPWTKDQVLLVKSSDKSKWVPVRPLPHVKNFPIQYDMCNQMLQKKKCDFTGNCTFAHSQEEKEMWMYMKNNDRREMLQIYDMWLTLSSRYLQADRAALTQPVPEERNIALPTDNAEVMFGFHCGLCGRHSNSERQWQKHISSDKHKDRVFSCDGEDEALIWSYRFPGARFDLCSKLGGACPEGMSCDYAHSAEELQEWIKRRSFLRQKLAKAREDMLIMPDENDFGKYNFLLQD